MSRFRKPTDPTFLGLTLQMFRTSENSSSIFRVFLIIFMRFLCIFFFFFLKMFAYLPTLKNIETFPKTRRFFFFFFFFGLREMQMAVKGYQRVLENGQKSRKSQ